MKGHPYKMHVWKERNINEVDLLKENPDLLKRVGLQRDGGHIEGKGN